MNDAFFVTISTCKLNSIVEIYEKTEYERQAGEHKTTEVPLKKIVPLLLETLILLLLLYSAYKGISNVFPFTRSPVAMGSSLSMTTVALASVVILATVFGNSLVLSVLLRPRNRSRHKTSPTYLLITNLAIVDLLNGLLTMPLIVTLASRRPKNPIGCTLTIAITAGLSNASSLGFVLLALERFLAVTFPFFYQSQVTPGRTLGGVLATYALAFVNGCVAITGNFGMPPSGLCVVYKIINPDVYLYNTLVYGQIFLLGLIVILCTGIFVVALKQSRKIRKQGNLNSNEASSQTLSEIRLAQRCFLLASVFALAHLPDTIFTFLAATMRLQCDLCRSLLYWIILLNSALNPLLFAYGSSKELRGEMIRVLCCRKKNSVDQEPSQ
ncbi:hypothetical protein CAPTEDRAFT_212596 [Capitella teleta]|uniref:G-protein coupled receptors family 1 profile domain-containing protein n=1 Tax=Capitella teleta TaxID=283909 RepID=R7TFJ9_CAPTE|nr:hypothetical protein CAPTEDRAFT_212596 [Capitella teleta]|eukprot:ELT92524.1 hypothetical protein CAPTEDRAFT_212596 [Capitella teleta]